MTPSLYMSTRHQIVISVLFVVIAVVCRLLPHAWNFTPIMAIGIIASLYLGVRYSLVIIAASMIISDLLIGFYMLPIMVVVYSSFLISAGIGYVAQRKWWVVGGAALTASLVFFLATNWAVWQFGTMYTHGFDGLIASYVAGLPFFKNSLVADVLYTLVLYGLMEYVVASRSQRSSSGVAELGYSKVGTNTVKSKL